MEDNNTSCFNYRMSSGESGTLSYHALGKAIDINPLYNPYVWTDREGETHCEPEEGEAYADREKVFSYKIEEDDLCVAPLYGARVHLGWELGERGEGLYAFFQAVIKKEACLAGFSVWGALQSPDTYRACGRVRLDDD